jgi:hypothetical protein
MNGWGVVAYVAGDESARLIMAQRLEAVGVDVREERRRGERRIRTSGRGDSRERRKRGALIRGSFVVVPR